MPAREKGNGRYEHTYQFIVPDEAVVEFSGKLLTLEGPPKIRADQMDHERHNGDTKPQHYVVEVRFESDSPDIPSVITESVGQISGVDFYKPTRH
ncbi:MAG: hypothetical protein ABH864_05795 [archaeon]